MNAWWFVLFPVIGALIGWCTNWLAVKMIFHPRHEFSILGLRVQGLLPRRRRDLARNVAETVERDLLSVEVIQKLVTGLLEGERVRALLHSRIESIMTEQIERFGPLVKTFLPPDLVEKVKLRVEEEVLSFIGSLSEEIHAGLGKSLDIHDMVRSRIESFDLVKLEEIVFRIAARELRHIEILGGVLGFIVGLAEVGIMAAIS